MSASTQVPLPALTGLRGILCLWVWFLHVAMFLWLIGGRPFDDVAGSVLTCVALHGYVAVDCFFMLSGFVLSYRYRRQQSLCTPVFLKHFWRARFARIYPLYVLTLLGMAAGVWCFGLGKVLHGFPPPGQDLPAYDPVSNGAFVENLFLVQSWDWFPRLTWNMAAWSISSEWAMYLLFPLIMVLIRRVQSMRSAFVCALIVQVIFIALLNGNQTAVSYLSALYENLGPDKAVMFDNAQRTSPAAVELGLLRALTGFISGCLLYQIYQNRAFKEAAIYRLSFPVVVIITGILLWTQVIYIYVWLLLLILILTDQRSVLTRILSTAPAQFLGNISYSVYLWHVPLLGLLLLWRDIADFLLTAHWALLGLLIMTMTLLLLGMSALSYWYIERPARTWLRGRPAPDTDV